MVTHILLTSTSTAAAAIAGGGMAVVSSGRRRAFAGSDRDDAEAFSQSTRQHMFHCAVTQCVLLQHAFH